VTPRRLELDRRQARPICRLTRAGRPVFARVLEVITRRNDEIFHALTAAERRQLGALLTKVAPDDA